MDDFLRSQNTGEIVESENTFTLDRSHSRDKLLASIPDAGVESVYRLLDASARQLGEHPAAAIRYIGGSKNRESRINLDLPKLEVGLVRDFLDELRRPFGERSAVSTLARAVFYATKVFSSVEVRLGGGLLREFWGGFILAPGRLDVPDDVTVKEPGLRVEFVSANRSSFRDHRRSVHSRIDDVIKRPERLLPMESLSRLVSGYFDYRTKPFTAIRSYFCRESDRSEPVMLLDLWNGPYDFIDKNTAVLKKKEPGKFLFLTWRPTYGTPTFLHHFLNVPVKAALHRVKATFWVESTDRAAHIHFFSRDMVSDPIPVAGPPGLSGLVIWSDLKYDLWGTRPVEDDNFQEAMGWAQSRVDETSRCLAENLGEVVERLRSSNVLKKSYADETIERIDGLWGKA